MPSFVGSVIAHANDANPKTPDFSGLGWSPGDLAIATCWRATFAGLFTAPAGWYTLGSRPDANTSARAGTIFYKILETGEDETPTFTPGATSAPSSVVISIWTGVSESNPLDAFSNPIGVFLNDATPTPDPITTLTDDALAVLWHASYFATSWTAGAPSGYTLDADYSGSTFDDRQQFLASKALGAAGTETPGDWTHSASPGNTEDGVRFSIALREPQAGTFPLVLEIAETQETSAATSHNILLPSVVVEDNLLLAICYFVGSAGMSFTSTPAGWTRLDPGNTGTSQALPWIAYKVSDGSEGSGTIAFSTSAVSTAAAQVFRIDGWTGDPPEYAETSGFSADPPSLSPSWGSDDNLYISIMANLGLASLPSSGFNWRKYTPAPPTPTIVASVNTGFLETTASSINPTAWKLEANGNDAGGLAAILAIRGDVPIGGGGDPGPGGTVGVGTGWGISI